MFISMSKIGPMIHTKHIIFINLKSYLEEQHTENFILLKRILDRRHCFKSHLIMTSHSTIALEI